MPNIELKTLSGFASNKVLKPSGTGLVWTTDDGGSPSNNVKTVQGGAGVDVGVLINAADGELGAAFGEIQVFGGGNITTPIIVGSNHKLKLHDGTYICNAADVPISLKDNSLLEGASWSTIIVEPVYPKSYRTVQAYNVKNPTTIRTGGTAVDTAQSTNITVKNIQFKGVRANRHDGGIAATVYLGNTHQGRVENCWFNATAAYGAQFGGHGGAGFYAKDGWYINNMHSNLMSQNLVVASVERMVIQGNIFTDPGKPPYTVTGASNANPIVLTFSESHHLVTGTEVFVKDVAGNTAANGFWTATYFSETQVSLNGSNGTTSTAFSGTAGTLTARTAQGAAIDVKANGDAHKDGERIIGVNIKNNIFDFRNVNTLFSAILYQIVAIGIRSEGALIEGNTLLGNETGVGQSLGGILITHPDTKGVTISNNYINRFIQRGLQLRGVRIKANNNQIILCGGDGGNAALSASDLEYSTIENNYILNRYDTNRTGAGTPSFTETASAANIFEKGVNRFNTWANNVYQRHEQKDGSGNPEAGAWLYPAATAWSVTDSTYKDNTVTGFQYAGITESANSNRNIYDGNITQLRSPTVAPFTQGLVVVGAQSRIISHKYTDGSIFFGSTRATL